MILLLWYDVLWSGNLTRVGNGEGSLDGRVRACRSPSNAQAAKPHYGFPKPITAISGNGVHVLYRINVPADDDGLTRRFLEVLARRFDNARASIDRGVFNPARISRFYGTRACKGEPTPDRPHRMAKIMNVPDSIQVVSAEALEAIVVETGSGDPGRIAGQRGVLPALGCSGILNGTWSACRWATPMEQPGRKRAAMDFPQIADVRP